MTIGGVRSDATPTTRDARGPAGPHVVTVFCVDDQVSVREAIRSLIDHTSGFVQIGEAGSGEDAVSAVATLCPDLVLMDIHLPGMDGFEAASLLLDSDRNLVVALMSADHIEPPLGFAPPPGRVVFVPKGSLSPRRLPDLWSGHRPG